MLKWFAIIFVIYSSGNAYSEIYKCKDSSGKFKFQDRPCLNVDETLGVVKYKAAPPAEEESSSILEAKKVVRSTLLFKPEKARFKRMKSKGGSTDQVVCGEVDSLNFAGQYIGYKKFAVHDGEMTWVKRLAKKGTGGSFGNALNKEYEKSLEKYLSLGCPKY